MKKVDVQNNLPIFRSGAEHVMESLLLIFFIYLTREQHYYLSQSQDLKRNIQAYIQANFRTTTLKETAAHFPFQPNYFSALVKKKTGKTFKQLLQECQMNMAANFLVNTDWSINHIIAEIGCSNATFFYRKFKVTYGLSPKSYREIHDNIQINL